MVENKDTQPQTFIAPKGFESGIFFLVILATSVIGSLIKTGTTNESADSDSVNNIFSEEDFILMN